MSSHVDPWLPKDSHPERLVESAQYPRPCPDWYAVRAWTSVYGKAFIPMYLTVDVTGVSSDTGDIYTNTRMLGTFQHPSKEYIDEVSRQLLCGERLAHLSAVDSPHWVSTMAVYTETCLWGVSVPKNTTRRKYSSCYIEYINLWVWDAAAGAPTEVIGVPSGIFNSAWNPAPVLSPILDPQAHTTPGQR